MATRTKKELAKRHKSREQINASKRNGTTWQAGQSGNPYGAALYAMRTSTELDVKILARRFTRQSIATAAVIMRNTKNPPMVRLAAVDLILKRGWGNPATVHQNPDGSALDFSKMDDAQLIESLGKITGLLDATKGASGTFVVPALEHRSGDDD